MAEVRLTPRPSPHAIHSSHTFPIPVEDRAPMVNRWRRSGLGVAGAKGGHGGAGCASRGRLGRDRRKWGGGDGWEGGSRWSYG